MLEKKIINVKNILKIIISCLVIVSMCKNCAKAYTWEEFKAWLPDYANQSGLSNDTREVCNYVNSRLNIIENNLPNITQCTNFYCYRVYSSRDRYYSYYFYAWKGNSYTYNNNSLYWANNGVQWIGLDSVYPNVNTYRWYTNFDGSNLNRSGFHGSLGLLENEPTSTISNAFYFNYVYPATIPFQYTPVLSVASGDFTYVKIDFVSNFIPLGVLGNNEYYQLDARFRDELSMKNLFNWSDVPGTRLNKF